MLLWRKGRLLKARGQSRALHQNLRSLWSPENPFARPLEITGAHCAMSNAKSNIMNSLRYIGRLDQRLFSQRERERERESTIEYSYDKSNLVRAVSRSGRGGGRYRGFCRSFLGEGLCGRRGGCRLRRVFRLGRRESCVHLSPIRSADPRE